MKRNRDKISLWKRKKRMSDAELLVMLRNSFTQQQPAMPQWVQQPQPTTAPQIANLGWFGAIVGAFR